MQFLSLFSPSRVILPLSEKDSRFLFLSLLHLGRRWAHWEAGGMWTERGCMGCSDVRLSASRQQLLRFPLPETPCPATGGPVTLEGTVFSASAWTQTVTPVMQYSRYCQKHQQQTAYTRHGPVSGIKVYHSIKKPRFWNHWYFPSYRHDGMNCPPKLKWLFTKRFAM